MTMYYAGFDVSQISGLGTITLSTAAVSDVVITLSSVTGTDHNGATTSKFLGYDVPTGDTSYQVTGQDSASTQHLKEYSTTGWCRALQIAIRAEMVAQSWPATTSFTIVRDNDTGVDTWDYDGAGPFSTWDAAWSTTAGRELCGYNQNFTGVNGSITTNNGTYGSQPSYTINASLVASVDGPHEYLDYEPRGVGNHVVDDAGNGYGISRSVAPLQRDWLQQFESNEKTFRMYAASSHPWTFQHLFEHCRGQFPFVVTGGFVHSWDEAFFLRTEGIPWMPRRAAPGWGSASHIPFRCYLTGQMVGS